MNRRKFIQSLVAMVSLPAAPSLSLGSATAAIPAATAVPTQARFWGIYMSALHGECPPHALQAMTNISAMDAKKYVSQMIAEGVIKPNPLLKKSVSKVLKTNEDSVLNKVKKRSKMKTQAKLDEVKVTETVEAKDDLEDELKVEVELLDEFDDVDQDSINEDVDLTKEAEKLDETTFQS